MRSIRRVGGTALAGLLLTAVVGGPAASAQTSTTTPESYVATAAGRALNLKVGTTGLTAGASNASLDSTPKATSQGTGFVSPINTQQTEKLEQSGDGTKNVAEACGTPSLPAPLGDVLSIGAGCSSALAEVKGGLPRSSALGKVAGVDVDLSVVTSQSPVPLEDTLGTILEPLLGGVGQVEDALSGVVGSPVQIGDTVEQVTSALLTQKTLEVDLGTSTSDTAADANKVTAVAKSEGGTIKLFPLGADLTTVTGQELAPIVEIIIGSAQASATYDRVAGKASGAFDPAILTININTPIVNNLGEITGQDLSVIKINPDLVPSQLSALDPVAAAVVTACSDAPNEFCILEGTPIETRIAVASGRTVTNADGSVSAFSNAVKINALKGIGAVDPSLEGGVLLEIAAAEAAAGGKQAVTTVAAPAPEVPRELPRTGGTPVIPMLAVAGLGIALAARRTLARAAR